MKKYLKYIPDIFHVFDEVSSGLTETVHTQCQLVDND